MTLWTAKEIAQATRGEAIADFTAERVLIDSREVVRGDLYVAIRGERLDGHEFVGEALSKGASGALVAFVPEGVDKAKCIVVDDTLEALQDLGKAGRARFAGKVIGLTGSVGKTSTKEMLKLAIGAHGNTFASHGNFNNHIGLPLNLANLPKDAEFAIIEMGMNHAGEIATLTSFANPHIAIITNVEAVHLEFFESVAAIADAKSEIFSGLVAGGTAILNRDNAWFERMEMDAKKQGVKNILAFGKNAAADVRLIDAKITAGGMQIKASAKGMALDYTIKAVGEHWATTSLIALATAEALGFDVGKTARALAEFEELAGRGKLTRITLPQGELTLLDDSYNASPASMRSALAKLKAVAESAPSYKRRVAILGKMLELGKDGPEMHKALVQDVIAAGVDKVFVCGDLMQHLFSALPEHTRGGYVDTAESLFPLVLEQLRADDLVLIKGSHGSKVYTIAEKLLASKNPARRANAV